MAYLRISIKPRSAFGTPIKGDTLFGHLCWAIVNRCGEARLRELLEGYLTRPFAVVSDAFPSGYWPRPELPPGMFGGTDPTMRKEARKRVWLPHSRFGDSMEDWTQQMAHAPEYPSGTSEEASRQAFITRETRFRNSIDRRTGATGHGFDPFASEEFSYCKDTCLECHVVYDKQRINPESLHRAIADIGAFGFGRDASVGLGRFDVPDLAPDHIEAGLPVQSHANAWLTLAPVAPQGLPFQAERSWYRPVTRFGRHGGQAVSLGNPFKAPLLLAETGAVLTPVEDCEARDFVGQGLGGKENPISLTIPETVHQGYAPVLGIRVPEQAAANAENAR